MRHQTARDQLLRLASGELTMPQLIADWRIQIDREPDCITELLAVLEGIQGATRLQESTVQTIRTLLLSGPVAPTSGTGAPSDATVMRGSGAPATDAAMSSPPPPAPATAADATVMSGLPSRPAASPPPTPSPDAEPATQMSGSHHVAAAAMNPPLSAASQAGAASRPLVPAAAAASAAAPFEPVPGAVVRGRFLLGERIGEGGMGLVFRATDKVKQEAGDPKHEVAVKLLNADLKSHPDAFVALQREASKAQTLAHPNIATVFDFDRDGDICFLVMELLQGQSLDAVIRSSAGGLERKAAIPIIRGIAEGLAYAHRKGIVHSDLKPANVFLQKDGTPKLLDFGIARSTPGGADGAPADTFDAGRLGAYTAAYATKEMIAGGDAAPADDLYALGIIAYQLLTSKHPYDRKSAPDAEGLGLAPAPIRALSRREWKALAQALAFERSKRPRDANEFLKAFFGGAAVRRALVAATVVLAAASAGLAYQNYRQAGPSIPFDQLPLETQQKLTTLMADGDKEWGFYNKEGADYALWSSIDLYSEAYSLHPRDRKAVSGLRRAADALLAHNQSAPDREQQIAKALAEKSEYLAKYKPVVNAMGPTP